MNSIAQLSKEFQVKPEYLKNITNLLADGNTIPFIARYRKEMTGSMDDQLLRQICERLDYLENLQRRGEEILAAVEAQGKLTEELSATVEAAQTLAELEDLYRPYRQKRKTRGSVARERGLEPLAAELLRQSDRMDPLSARRGIS